MAEMINNLYLVNAPAGSGKTTKIKSMITEVLGKSSSDNILCITYTNRAADELMEGIESNQVQIQTIHSFMSEFMSIYFSHNEILDLYYTVYGDNIRKRIENSNNDEYITNSNEKYVDKYGKLDFETVRSNIKNLFYNELKFNSLYYGGIGHDDLLSFANIVFTEFPKIKRRITQKFQYIFIDEYQDTSASVLSVFYESVKDSNTLLYLFGDKMQQIYKNYDGSFEEELLKFNSSISLNVNYRSTSEIVKVLNNIYNDKDFVQMCSVQKEGKISIKPRVVISNNVSEAIEKVSKENSDCLKLYVFNSQRFNTIGAGTLYNEVNKLDKYKFGGKYSAVDVLTDQSENNPDAIMNLLFGINRLLTNYSNQKYGLTIQQIKKDKLYNQDQLLIYYHSDKVMLKSHFDKVKYAFERDISIKEILELIEDMEFMSSETIREYIELEEYSDVLNVSLTEFRNLCLYLLDPRVSTQHGVKGEGHESVCFIAENSGTPSVKIYEFLKLWSTIDICFVDFQNFYYEYLPMINELESKLGVKISELKKDTYATFKIDLEATIAQVMENFNGNAYFEELVLDKIQLYLSKPGVTKLRNALNINSVYGVLSAYKLFYVGCSRAREQLTIVLNESKIINSKQSLVQRLQNAGFDVD